jgi:hypothetical protein
MGGRCGEEQGGGEARGERGAKTGQAHRDDPLDQRLMRGKTYEAGRYEDEACPQMKQAAAQPTRSALDEGPPLPFGSVSFGARPSEISSELDT